MKPPRDDFNVHNASGYFDVLHVCFPLELEQPLEFMCVTNHLASRCQPLDVPGSRRAMPALAQLTACGANFFARRFIPVAEGRIQKELVALGLDPVEALCELLGDGALPVVAPRVQLSPVRTSDVALAGRHEFPDVG